MTNRRCIICGAYGSVALGIRARYDNTNAVWAPNLDAYLCDAHATAGVEIRLVLTPTDDGRVTTHTRSSMNLGSADVSQSLVIGTGEKVTPGQESLV